jgi:two-component system chemotaxis response regulator CheB
MIHSMSTPGSQPAWLPPALAARRPRAIVVAGSAGGVEALMTLLSCVPANLQVPLICMLHLPANRDSRLAELFGERLPVPVLEAADKGAIVDGAVYFAGSGYHLSVEQDRSFSLSCEAPVHFARPAIDVLMTSAADAYGVELAAILLTGANIDGAAGMAHVHARGGLTVVQDPLDAAVATMPQAAIAACAPDLVLPLAAIRELLQFLLEKK